MVTNWDDCFEIENINTICDRWTNKFLNIDRENIPNKIVKIRTHEKPFYNNQLRQMCRKEDRARKEAQRLKTQSKWTNYRNIRNLYNRSVIEAKEAYDF